MSKLSIVFILLILICFPVSAHLPEVKDPENYIPTLGWVTDIEGNVLIKTLAGDPLEINEGDPIIGDCIIETGDDSYISLSLEDYKEHESTLTVDYKSMVQFKLSEGKHFDDTISNKWYIDPHQVSLDMNRGNLYVIVKTNNEDFGLNVQTPNTETRLPHNFKQYQNIDFYLSVLKSENQDTLDMSSQMQDFFGQLQEMSGEDMDEETAEEYNDIISEFSELGTQMWPNIPGQGIITQLEVYNGELIFSSDTDAGSSEKISVKSEEIYLVDGINPPMRVGDEASNKPGEGPQSTSDSSEADSLEGLPTVSLNIDLDEGNARPELAESIKTQLDIITAETDGTEMSDMMKMNVWVYEVKGDPEKILNDNNWPPGTQKKTENKDIGEEIYNLIDNYGDSLDNVWGEDWSFKAEMEAENYIGQKSVSITYSYTEPPVNSRTVNIVSPWIDPKTLKLYEGTYIMIIETSMEMSF